jgi:uncharacterized protein Smg (DUF494 family)
MSAAKLRYLSDYFKPRMIAGTTVRYDSLKALLMKKGWSTQDVNAALRILEERGEVVEVLIPTGGRPRRVYRHPDPTRWKPWRLP